MNNQQYHPTNEEVNSSANTDSETVDGTGAFASVNALNDIQNVYSGTAKYAPTILAAKEHNDKMQSLRNELHARSILEHKDGILALDDDSIPWILNHIDCFVSQSRGNKHVVVVLLNPNVYLNSHAFSDHDDDVWDKLGRAVGNLQKLAYLPILVRGRAIGNHGEEVVRQDVIIKLNDTEHWNVEEMRALARAIRGHPTITRGW
jgi:hypothetical protein